MKLNSIHTKLSAAYPNQEELKKVLGFYFTPDDYMSRCMNLFKRGYWSLAPFAFSGTYNFAVRLMPSKKLLDSPIVYLGNNDPVTVSPRLGTFIPFFSLSFFDNPSFVAGSKKTLLMLKKRQALF